MGNRKGLSPVKFLLFFAAEGSRPQGRKLSLSEDSRLRCGGASRWGTPASRVSISELNSLVSSKNATALAPQMQP